MAEKAFYTKLKNRGVVRISGVDAAGFLQGLISNDIALLDKQPCVYACFLNPQGKFLHDFFITEQMGTYYIECEGGARARDLAERLSKFRLRAKIDLQCDETVPVYVGVNVRAEKNPDPRHPEMGFRSFDKPELEEKPFDVWDRHRILLAVPDGSRDMIPEKSTLLESNIDTLNGISWEKGCYVGQELTARMNYRGLAKKHLRTVRGELLRDPGAEIIINGKLAGEMRSRCGDVGLALMKDEFN